MATTAARPKTNPKPEAAPVRERHQIITESLAIREAESDEPVITALLARGNIINRNGRYYSATVLERAANAARDRVEQGRVIGLMDHPNWWNGEGDRGKPERTAIRWSKLWMDGPDLRGEGSIVMTALGRDLLALYDAKVHIGLSTNAYASRHFETAKNVPAPYDGDEDDLIEVIDDIEELLTIDVVNDPSNIYAQVDRAAREAREAYRKECRMDKSEGAETHETVARADHERVTKELAEARKELAEAQAALAKERRDAIVREAIAARGGASETLTKTATLLATAAESDDAARQAVSDLFSELKTGNHGSNSVPAASTEGEKKTGDPLRETRQSLKVN